MQKCRIQRDGIQTCCHLQGAPGDLLAMAADDLEAAGPGPEGVPQDGFGIDGRVYGRRHD
jgi:hypothetical protein